MVRDAGDPLTFVDESRGLPPGTWGPCTWSALHYIALAYPETPTETCQGDYRTFLNALARVLPCAKCREGLKCHLRDSPPAESLKSGRDAFFRWTVDLHNAVNEKTGAQRYDPAAVRKLYDAGLGCRSSTRSLRWERWPVAAVLALSAFLAILVVHKGPWATVVSRKHG